MGLIFGQNSIGEVGELIAVADRVVHIHGDHVVPARQIGVSGKREFVLTLL